MDEIIRLVDALNVQPKTAAEELFAVATVVNTKGSVYRRPGARMLIDRSMKVSGAVSAGCLERDIIAQCESLYSSPRPLLLTYDGESADELIFGLRLGCDGIVQILVEPAALINESLLVLRKAVPELFARSRKMAAVTVFSVESSNSDPGTSSYFDSIIGTVLLANENENAALKPIPETICNALLEKIPFVLEQVQSQVVEILVDGLIVRAFIELSLPRQSLLVFGKGQDTVPLLEIAKVLGWQVKHIAGRQYADEYEALNGELFDGCVIMTHDYEADKLILQKMFGASMRQSLPAYVGIVGPKRRSQKLFAELTLAGLVITPEQQMRVFSPVGLDIGAERPEEIALSILAEIQAVRTEHPAGFLRDKVGPIHSTRTSLNVSDDNKSIIHFPDNHSINSSCNILDA